MADKKGIAHPSPLPKAVKSMGQNFLVNRDICRSIVDAAGFDAGDTILELGPGLGAITFELAGRVSRVVAVELDARMFSYLEAKAQAEKITNITLVSGNMLHLCFEKLAKDMGVERLRIIGNLPYNISSPMLFHMVDAGDYIDQAVVMLQKEVADRLIARPGCKDYGILSVIFQYSAEMEQLLQVAPCMFRPAPKVMSSVIKIRFRPPVRRVSDFHLFVRLVRAVFQQRRKTLANSLRAFLGAESSGRRGLSQQRSIEALECLNSCGIRPERRPEELTVEEFVGLADVIAAHALPLHENSIFVEVS